MEIIVPLSQNKYIIISWQDAEFDSNSWCLASGGCAVRHNPAGKANICLQRMVMSRVLGRALEEYEFVDHINGDNMIHLNWRHAPTKKGAESSPF